MIGGAGSALFNLLLPALVVRHLGKLEFSVWSLALQVLIYLQIFGFGLQTAMTKYIAHGHALIDIEDQRKTVKAGLVLAGIFALLAAVAVGGLVIFYPLLFSNVPRELVSEFRICIFVLGISAAWQLLSLMPMGLFIGMHRNIIPVTAQLLVRMLSLFMLWVVLQNGAGLLVLSLTMAICGALLVPMNYMAARRWASDLLIQLGALDRVRFREMLGYCGSLAVWNIAMLLVSGVAIMMVGYFDFQRVASYSLAATLITIMIGVQQAIISPLLPAGAKLNAREETRPELAGLLNRSTLICMLSLGLSVLLMKFLGDWFLQLWLGKGYSPDILKILLILAAANLIRNTALPYSMLLLAVNMQKQVQLTVLVEGIVTLIASLTLASSHGAIGIAYGALVGSIAGLLCNYTFNFSKTRLLVPNILKFSIKSGIYISFIVAIFVIVF